MKDTATISDKFRYAVGFLYDGLAPFRFGIYPPLTVQGTGCFLGGREIPRDRLLQTVNDGRGALFENRLPLPDKRLVLYLPNDLRRIPAITLSEQALPGISLHQLKPSGEVAIVGTLRRLNMLDWGTSYFLRPDTQEQLILVYACRLSMLYLAGKNTSPFKRFIQGVLSESGCLRVESLALRYVHRCLHPPLIPQTEAVF